MTIYYVHRKHLINAENASEKMKGSRDYLAVITVQDHDDRVEAMAYAHMEHIEQLDMKDDDP